MDLERLLVRNFLGIHDLDLSFQRGLHFVEGRNYDMSPGGEEGNGAGKSTIIEAIRYALYGTLGRPKRREDDVINRFSEGGSRVELLFRHGGRCYEIHRFRSDPSDGSGVRWFLDGVEKTKHTVPETKADILDILPISEAVFLHAVGIGQGMPDRFLDLPARERGEILCEVVGLGVYDEALRRSKESLSESEARYRHLESQVADTRSGIERWEAEVEASRRELSRAEEIEAEEVSRKKKSIDECTAKLSEASHALKGALSERDRLRVHAEASQSYYEVREKRLREVGSLHAEKSWKLDAVVTEQKKVLSSPETCSYCGQPVRRETLLERMASLAAERVPLEEDLRRLSEDKMRLDSEIGPYKETWENSVEKLLVAERALGLQAQEVRTLEARRRDVEGELSREGEVLSILRERVSRSEGEVGKLTEELRERMDSLLSEKEKITHFSFWGRTLPVLRQSALAEVVRYLNERISCYLEVFSQGTLSAVLSQRTERGRPTVAVDLDTPGGSYDLSSGGERRRVDLSLHLSLSDLFSHVSGESCNLFFADEVSDGISPEGVARFLEIMREKGNNGRCVYVVSHNPAVKLSSGVFDSVLTLEKRKGGATLREVQV
jgi:DNA repair protein SbcC/Rad50